MYGGDTDAVPVNSHEECRKMCNEMSHCKRWTYQLPATMGACDLKRAMAEGKEYVANEAVKLCFRYNTGFKNANKKKGREKGKEIKVGKVGVKRKLEG